MTTSLHDSVRRAEAFYKVWSKKDSRRTKRVKFHFPDPAAIFGYATRITYLSDKWKEDGDTERYAHAFLHPKTLILVEPPKRGSEAARLNKGTQVEAPLPPSESAYTLLALAMHIEYREKEKGDIKYWAFPEENMPMLAHFPDLPNVIFLVWQDRPCWIVTSPILRVTERGILH